MEALPGISEVFLVKCFLTSKEQLNWILFYLRSTISPQRPSQSILERKQINLDSGSVTNQPIPFIFGLVC